jgi:2-(1,2-epoxy-1,2-dihydrophenyl)acetyl-CoA isomerase
MAYQHLNLHKQGGVWTLTLHRPEVFNALHAPLIHEIRAVAELAKVSDEVRVLLITGSGKAFCSGADLRAVTPEGDVGDVLRTTYNPMILALRGLDKPVIGAINGVAAGAGCSLALACDYLVAKDDASFAELFCQVGLTLDAGSTAFLMQSVGYHKAFELASTARRFSAQEAKELGLVAEVISTHDWERRLAEIAFDFSNKPTRALGLIKQALQAAEGKKLAEVLEIEANGQLVASQTADFREGIAAFLQKRSPSFTGK